MRHLKAAIERPRKPSGAMQLGTAIHVRLLEPDEYKKTYVISQPCCGIVKSGKRSGEVCGRFGEEMSIGPDEKWYCYQHVPAGGTQPEHILKSSDAAAIEEMVECIQKRKVWKLLESFGGVEVSYVWDQVVEYEVDGKPHQTTMRMKMRVDKDLSGLGSPMLVDIKKTRRGKHRNRAFQSAIYDYNYDTKAALYLDGAMAVDGIRREWIWLAIEDSYPFDTNPIRASDAMIATGRRCYKEVLSEYARCKHLERENPDFDWPGAYEDIHLSRDPWWGKDDV